MKYSKFGIEIFHCIRLDNNTFYLDNTAKEYYQNSRNKFMQIVNTTSESFNSFNLTCMYFLYIHKKALIIFLSYEQESYFTLVEQLTRSSRIIVTHSSHSQNIKIKYHIHNHIFSWHPLIYVPQCILQCYLIETFTQNERACTTMLKSKDNIHFFFL